LDENVCQIVLPESLIEGPNIKQDTNVLLKPFVLTPRSKRKRRDRLFPNTLQKQKCCAQILVVDDCEFNIHALTLMLKSYKLKVDCAVNGSQALEKILKRKDCDCQYALVLLDINMPVMNGYDTCVEIRNLIKNKKISPMHVVAVTADVSPMQKEQCFLSGFDSVVEKPIYKKTLEKVLTDYLEPGPRYEIKKK